MKAQKSLLVDVEQVKPSFPFSLYDATLLEEDSSWSILYCPLYSLLVVSKKKLPLRFRSRRETIYSSAFYHKNGFKKGD